MSAFFHCFPFNDVANLDDALLPPTELECRVSSADLLLKNNICFYYSSWRPCTFLNSFLVSLSAQHSGHWHIMCCTYSSVCVSVLAEAINSETAVQYQDPESVAGIQLTQILCTPGFSPTVTFHNVFSRKTPHQQGVNQTVLCCCYVFEWHFFPSVCLKGRCVRKPFSPTMQWQQLHTRGQIWARHWKSILINGSNTPVSED